MKDEVDGADTLLGCLIVATSLMFALLIAVVVFVL